MMLITGVPCSGKTRRLVGEIQGCLAEGVSPYMILATTFSRQAAREIADRLGEEVPVRTIHGTSYWMFRLARQVRGERTLEILSQNGALTLMERTVKEEGVKIIDPRQAILELERIQVLGGRYASLYPQEQLVIRRYFHLLGSENLLDFTGLLEA